MRERLEWVERDGAWWVDLDAAGGGRYLVARPAPEPGWFVPAFVVDPGEAEREIGEGQPDLASAQEMATKVAIQALARIHGVSPAPGRPEPDAPEGERLIAALWDLLARTVQ